MGAERLDQAWRDGLLGPGRLFELVDDDVAGVSLSVFAQRSRSMVEVLARAATSYGDRPYLVGPDHTVTFAEAPAAAARFASVLVDQHGLAAGDRVALAGRFSVEHAMSVWGATHAGAVVATMNPAWTATELATASALVSPRLLVVDDDVAARIADGGGIDAPVIRFADLAAEADEVAGVVAPPAEVHEDDPFAIIFTSGTTGTPKGATLSHRNAIQFSMAAAATSAVHSIINEIPRGEGVPAVIAASPLFHISGLLGQLTNSACWGTTLVVAPAGRWDATVHLELTERHRVTSWSIVPTQLWRLIDHPHLDRYDLSSLEMVGGGGATFPPELLRRTAERLPGIALALRVGYGMTETAGTATLLQPPIPDDRLASVGTPVAGAEVKIVGADGRPVPDGEIGEISIRSAQVFLGYWGNEAATAAVLDADRWYRTGDFGRLDDGYLTLESRLRDLIIRGGENIYPIEVENRLVEHPDIDDAAVLGVDHPTLGQEVRAVIVVRDGATVTTDDVRQWAGAALARFKVPTVVDVVDALPRNETGKVLKAQLAR
jgi:acyl-CoA synthetase (AMP-forming)/AMP-acid ligase II